jgi:hypothetical protein
MRLDPSCRVKDVYDSLRRSVHVHNNSSRSIPMEPIVLNCRNDDTDASSFANQLQAVLVEVLEQMLLEYRPVYRTRHAMYHSNTSNVHESTCYSL